MMKSRAKVLNVISYIFFLIYFISYIGENTNLKYVGIIFFQLFLIFHLRKDDISNHEKGFTIIISLIFISLLASLFVNFNFSGAIKTLSLIDLFIITYFMLSKALSRFGFYERQLIVIITNTLFVGLLLAFLFHYNDTTISYGRSTTASLRHVFGLGAASIVGFLCFIEVTLSFYLLMTSKNRRVSIENIFIVLKISLAIYMAYLTDIRASIVSMALFIIMYLFYKMPHNKCSSFFKIMILIGFVFLSSVYLLTSDFNISRLDYILSHRLEYYKSAINEIFEKNALLFGVGSFRNSEVSDMSMIQIDNSFLDILYQYGIVTAFGFVILMIKIGTDLKRIDKSRAIQAENKYRIFINSYYVSILAYSMVEKNLFSISSALSMVSFLLLFWYIEKNNIPQKTLDTSIANKVLMETQGE